MHCHQTWPLPPSSAPAVLVSSAFVLKASAGSSTCMPSTVVGCLQATAPLRWPCMAPHLSVVQGPSFGGRPAGSRPICALHDPRPQQRNLPAHRAQHRPACQLSCSSPINRRHLPASPARRRPVRVNSLGLFLPTFPWLGSAIAITHVDPKPDEGKRRPRGGGLTWPASLAFDGNSAGERAVRRRLL